MLNEAIRAIVLGCGLLASGAQAATLDESALPGGAFSGSWASPTQVAAGVTTITGAGNGNQFDNLVFTTLAPGAQTIGFTFTAPSGINASYAAGGSFYYKTSPFLYGWDGTNFGNVFVSFVNQTATATLSLGVAFTGTLYLALNFTFGSNLNYAISVPTNAIIALPPAAVPVPAAGLLLVAGLGALTAFGRRRQPTL